MIEYIQSADAKVPVVLTLSADGLPATGIAFGSVTVTVEKSDGTTASITMSGANWAEVTTGAFSGVGKYNLVLPASALDVVGLTAYSVKTSTTVAFVGFFEVVASPKATQAGVDTLLAFAGGRWKIHSTGADANRIVYYADDGTTVVAKFDLKDVNGDPTYRGAFERVPV